jgi:hypothetical protein
MTTSSSTIKSKENTTYVVPSDALIPLINSDGSIKASVNPSQLVAAGASDIVADKAAAQAKTPAAGITLYILSADGRGNMWRGVAGAAASTYADDGGAFCGTIIIPSGGDGTTAWLRDFDGGVYVKWFGAFGGVTVDTVGVLAALNAGFKKVSFGADSYTCGSVLIPESVEVDGQGSAIIPAGNPTQVFSIVDKPNVSIHNFVLNGSCTYFIHSQGGNTKFNTFKNIKVTGGTGTAVIRFYNDSGTVAPSRCTVSDIDARVSNWDHTVLCERGAVAEAAEMKMDNYDIQRINAWPELSTFKATLPVSSFSIRKIYGALFGSGSLSVVHIVPDSGYAEHVNIDNIHAESWFANQYAVHLVDTQYSTVSTVKSIRLNVSKSGQRAIKLEDVRFCKFNNFAIRDTGEDYATTPAGFYPAIDFDSLSHDNSYSILDRSLTASRTLDNGYRNILEFGFGEDGFDTDNARDALTASTDETTLKTYTIGANALRSTDSFKVVVTGSASGGAGIKTIKFKFGGTTISGGSITGGAGDTGYWKSEIIVSNLTDSTQRIVSTNWTWGTNSNVNSATGVIDTTANAIFSVTGQLEDGADTINVDQFIITALRHIASV